MHPLAPIVVVLLSSPFVNVVPKCPASEVLPGYEPNRPVVLLDGVVFENGLEGLDTGDVASIDVTCWSPESGEFGDTSGIQVVRIVSKSLAAEKHATVLDFLTAHAEYVRQNGRLPRSLEEVRGTAGDALKTIEYAVSESRWSAFTKTDGEAFRCSVEDSSTILSSDEAQIRCRPVASRGNQAMRSLYEASRRATQGP